jgi:hypothetical protein
MGKDLCGNDAHDQLNSSDKLLRHFTMIQNSLGRTRQTLMELTNFHLEVHYKENRREVQHI